MTSPLHGDYRPVATDPTGTSEAAQRHGTVTTIETTGGSNELAAIGRIRPDEPNSGEATIRLIVSVAVRRVGRGQISLTWQSDQLSIAGGALIWIVTTNKGWAHLRGDCWDANPKLRLPFRVDLFSASAIGSDAPDRVALRVYAPDVDPNTGSPTHKIFGSLGNGGIRLFGD